MSYVIGMCHQNLEVGVIKWLSGMLANQKLVRIEDESTKK